MRELTAYEKKKWFDGNIFTPPEVLPEGSEWGYFMNLLEPLTHIGSDYGMSDEFEEAVQVEYLDRYYDQLYYIYMREWGMDTPDDFGLPPAEEVERRQNRAIELGVEKLTAVRMALDWAMRWREAHAEDTFKQKRKEALQKELAALGE